jgi:hypothetical protein
VIAGTGVAAVVNVIVVGSCVGADRTALAVPSVGGVVIPSAVGALGGSEGAVGALNGVGGSGLESSLPAVTGGFPRYSSTPPPRLSIIPSTLIKQALRAFHTNLLKIRITSAYSLLFALEKSRLAGLASVTRACKLQKKYENSE